MRQNTWVESQSADRGYCHCGKFAICKGPEMLKRLQRGRKNKNDIRILGNKSSLPASKLSQLQTSKTRATGRQQHKLPPVAWPRPAEVAGQSYVAG